MSNQILSADSIFNQRMCDINTNGLIDPSRTTLFFYGLCLTSSMTHVRSNHVISVELSYIFVSKQIYSTIIA